MKKKAKQIKNKRSSKEQLDTVLYKLRSIFAAHGVFIMFVIAGSAIGFALYKSRTYLNPVRNEDKYQELSSKNNFSKIDYTIVDKLSDALKDIDVKASQAIDPNRKNPFSE
jgi:predicted Zn-dependent protease